VNQFINIKQGLKFLFDPKGTLRKGNSGTKDASQV